MLTQACRQRGTTAGEGPDHHAIYRLKFGEQLCGDVPKPTRYSMTYDRTADRLSDDQTDLGTLHLSTGGVHAAPLEVNHQVRVGSSHATLDGLSEFG
ncbi:hypothetical protein UI24_26060 [Mycobacteroides franklinii]|nr:hypothetical protein [Mycobacteroides franklinii]